MPNVDPLTGLLTGDNLDRRLQRLMDLAEEAGMPLSLIICDVHHLKDVNARYGWATGDLLVQAVAHTLRAAMDPAFTCWRLGGDAFLVALPTTPLERARLQGERLLSAMSQTTIEGPDGGKITPLMSMGISTFPQDAQTPRGLVRVADRRMHASKEPQASK